MLRVMACGALISAIGCGGGGGNGGGAADGGSGTGKSYAGGHGMAFYHLATSNAKSISTPAMTVQAAGSTILVSVGHGAASLLAAPTDSAGNKPYKQLDQTHNYTNYTKSGTAVYAFQNAKGGDNVVVTTATGNDPSTGQADEVTIAAVEVAATGKIQQVAWNEVPGPPAEAIDGAVTSKSVTTDGPATLVSFWWGDGFYPGSQQVSVNNGFQIIDTNTDQSDSFVQCAVGVKTVTAAGTYDVAWTGGSTAGETEGAQVYLIAVE